MSTISEFAKHYVRTFQEIAFRRSDQYNRTQDHGTAILVDHLSQGVSVDARALPIRGWLVRLPRRMPRESFTLAPDTPVKLKGYAMLKSPFKSFKTLKDSTADSLQRLENLAWMCLTVLLAVVATLFAIVVS